jgi:GntR family transcriptional regulator, transcriptional repressor for pyruvate dehydrogenase complex
MLEQKVVQLVIERASDSELDKLGETMSLLSQSNQNSDLVLQLHHKLALLTKNIVLIKFMLANWELHKKLTLTNSLFEDESRTRAVLKEHKAILDAIKERNVEKARQLVVSHLRHIKEFTEDRFAIKAK